MDPADTFEHAGLGVRILWEEFDLEHANPRSDDGNIGVMFCEHSHYSLGDKDAEDPRGHETSCDRCEGEGEVPEVLRDGLPSTITKMVCPKCEGVGEVEVSITDYLKANGATVVLPLFLLDHSGITIRAGANLLTGADNFRRTGRFMGDDAGWDTSSVGIIYDTPETRKELTDQSPEHVEDVLDEEVRLYAAYLEGSVYGYEIVELDEDGEVPDEDGKVLDSCWGFLEINVQREDAYVRQAAREAAECERELIDRETTEAAYWAARDVVTI